MSKWHYIIPWMLSAALLACGGTQPVKAPSPRELLAAGQYAQARKAATMNGATSLEDRAIIGLSILAEAPDEKSVRRAVDALVKNTNGIGGAGAADLMLKLAFELPSTPDQQLTFSIIESALGAAGQGRFKPIPTPQITVGIATRNVAVHVLERLELGYSVTSDAEIDTGRIRAIWNACYALLDGRFATADHVLAWKLIRGIGGLAIAINAALPKDELTTVLLRSAVESMEANPDLALAAKCDMASPYDKLKLAIRHDRKLAQRLEQALASAKGCTRGTYAPQNDQ